MNDEAAFAALIKTRDALERIGVPYCLDGGTLIGMARDGAFVPDDKDIDITVFEQGRRMSDIATAFIRARFQHVRHRNLGPPLGTTKVYARAARGVMIDVVNKVERDGMAAWTIVGTRNHVKTVPSVYYESFDSITVRGEAFSVPAHYLEYLAFRWGADWRVPLTGRAYNRMRHDRAYEVARNAGGDA